MYYYSVSYKTYPSTLLTEIQNDIGNADAEMFFLFGHQNKLNEEQIKYALESYLNNNKIEYTTLIISNSKQISEKEYNDSTQYS
jgi:hypothetical protein